MDRVTPPPSSSALDALDRAAIDPRAPPLWPKRVAHGLIPWPERRPPRHVHVIPSLSLGGAERIVADLAAAWSESGTEADIVVLRLAETEHRIAGKTVRVHRLGAMPYSERLCTLVSIAREAGSLPVYCHLSTLEEMQALWRGGIRTIPVVHNVARGWRQDPTLWARDEVPFVVACGEVVAAELRAEGFAKPIRVLRHVVPPPPPMAPARRAALRDAFGAAPGTRLIGMIGRIVPQKNYARALDILAALAPRRDAKLAVVGAVQGEEGRRELATLVSRAHKLGIRDRLVLPGPVADAHGLLGAFDLFLNTSDFEGVSIATMEAVAAGLPAVVSDVGGQREIAGVRLVAVTAGLDEWVHAIESTPATRIAAPADRRAEKAAAELWPWLAALGPGSRIEAERSDVLFVTGNLDVGGAQRSLVNLAGSLPNQRIAVAVCGPVGIPDLVAQAGRANFYDLAGGGGIAGRIGRVLALTRKLAPRTLAFWNMDAATKLAVVKALAGGPVRVTDVSPGPMLFDELKTESNFSRLLSFEPDIYIRNLSCFVAKFTGGLPPTDRPGPARCDVIPNGVPEGAGPLPAWEGPAPPSGCNPALALVVVSRLAPAKKLELLPRVARRLDRLVPGATITLVGALHEGSSAAGWERLWQAAGTAMPRNLHIAGGDHRTTGFLHRFAALVMISEAQGCPNVSLEAMACGVPVVANDDGGTREQVIDGVTGRLVPALPDAELADALADAAAELLTDPERRRAMGEAARRHAIENFSMTAMAARYRRALLPDDLAEDVRCSAG